MNLVRISVAALLLAVVSAAQASCGAAFCTINTNWDMQGAWGAPGARFDLRYESIDQDQPRTGSRNVAVGEIPRHHDEVSTKNRNWLGTFDYTFGPDWGLSASLGLVDREHSHIHNHRGAKLPEDWQFSAAGDARLVARYRLTSFESREASSLGSAGLNFGVKLPTGRFDERNAAGTLAERSLQPGTGTTDALLGAFVAQSLPMKDLSWFLQGMLQLPLNTRSGYQPGERLSVDTGLRYEAGERLSLLLQLNFLARGRDSGVEAEPEDTGGTSLFVGPGLSYAVTNDIQVYGFVQLPLAQHVNGVQLVAKRAAVLGISARF